jgi:hypothetical protein
MAEIRDGRYMFSAVDGTTVDTMLHSLPLTHTPGARIVETVLPQMALRKAHRLCCEQLHDDAVRLLRQHGAELMVAEAVVDSFSNQGESIHILYLLRTTGAPKTIERTYLWSRGLCFLAEQTVQGLRTCTRFTASETADVRQTIQNISMAFLENT